MICVLLSFDWIGVVLYRFASRPGFCSRSFGLVCLSLVCLVGNAAAADPIDPSPVVIGYERLHHLEEDSDRLAGQVLWSELSCTQCHGEDLGFGVSGKRGPSLLRAGRALQADWISEFLQTPHAVKPGTSMPDMLGQVAPSQRQQVADAITAFLVDAATPFVEVKAGGASPVPYQFWTLGDVARGREGYHRFGCVACHAPEPGFAAEETADSALERLRAELDPEELEELGLAAEQPELPSVPHADLGAKYDRQGLTRFLLNPLTSHPAGRMPHFQLSVTEAADIAAFLLQADLHRNGSAEAIQAAPIQHAWTGWSASQRQEAIQEGKEWFSKLHCNQCHDAPGIPLATQSLAKPLGQRSEGDPVLCQQGDVSQVPHYSLTSEQEAGLKAALIAKDRLAAESESDAQKIARESLHFELLRQNCYACHQRAEIGGIESHRSSCFATVGDVDLGDEGRLPPPLDHVGYKLELDWMKKRMRGDTGKLRPYLQIRMPVFGAEVTAAIPEVFKASDSTESETVLNSHSPTGKAWSAEAGRNRFDQGCVQCHPVRGEALPGVVGIDLGNPGRRLNQDWFQAFLTDPAQLKPRTRMPKFFPNQVPSGAIEEMWAYLNSIDKQELPEKIKAARAANYELVPTERPILLRTFLEGAGNHAIAVGFPEGVHVAYDAEACKPAYFWRGSFLDAEGTWFVRFAPLAKPLGKEEFSLEDPYPLQWKQPVEGEEIKATAPQFAGYRIDSDGVPTFLSHWHGWEVSDRFQPDGNGIRRVIQWRPMTAASEPPKGELSFDGAPLKQARDVKETSSDGINQVEWKYQW